MPRVPARIPPFNKVVYTLQVDPIGIVIRGEEIALIVPGEFLRISQSIIEKLHIGSIGIASEDRS